jgi:hypothetical protein
VSASISAGHIDAADLLDNEAQADGGSADEHEQPPAAALTQHGYEKNSFLANENSFGDYDASDEKRDPALPDEVRQEPGGHSFMEGESDENESAGEGKQEEEEDEAETILAINPLHISHTAA